MKKFENQTKFLEYSQTRNFLNTLPWFRYLAHRVVTTKLTTFIQSAIGVYSSQEYGNESEVINNIGIVYTNFLVERHSFKDGVYLGDNHWLREKRFFENTIGGLIIYSLKGKSHQSKVLLPYEIINLQSMYELKFVFMKPLLVAVGELYGYKLPKNIMDVKFEDPFADYYLKN